MNPDSDTDLRRLNGMLGDAGRLPNMDNKLADAGYQLGEEIRDGRWNHVSDLSRKPAPACAELIDQLQKRCPGFSLSDYQQALADGLQNSR